MQHRTIILSLVLSILTMWLLIPPVVQAGEEVDLVLWINPWQQKAIEGIKTVAALFAEKHPEVGSVTVTTVGQNELAERLMMGTISGTPPDAVAMPAPVIQYALAELIQPIDTYLDKSEHLSSENYPPLLIDSFTAGGRQYGIPALEVGPGLVLIYSRELFAEAGLSDRGPSSLEELYQMHRKLTVEKPDGSGLDQVGINPTDAMGGTYFPTIWSTVFDVQWYDTEQDTLDLMAFAEAVEYIKRIYDTPGYELITGAGIGGWLGGLTSRRLAMQINGYWIPGGLKGHGLESEFGYTWMPSVLGDTATAILPWGLCIPVDVPRPDLSFALIEFFTSAEAAQILFDAAGWLNGNLSAIQSLDISALPIVAPIVAMYEEATRLNAPPPIPMLETIRREINNELKAVWRTEQAPNVVLENLERKLQLEVNQALGVSEQ
ncbi:MAG: extracellular solute-binding protein [Limnochordia bacterium]|nr:extracellular solute-binding protein [Limnochordia bacterium]